MNHPTRYGDPRSDPPAGRRRADDDQSGSDRGGNQEDVGYHGGGSRHYEAGGYAAPAHAGLYPDSGERSDRRMGEASDSHRPARADDRQGPGGGPSSTYGGLGGDRPYGTHGWTRGGGGYDMDDHQFDADYRQWREQQMRELDRDYAQWRQERYRKFSEEFDQWRATRRAGTSAGGDTPQGSESPGGDSATRTPKTG